MDDQEGVRTLDDDNFIDDTGVDPAHGYGSENEHSLSRAPEVPIRTSAIILRKQHEEVRDAVVNLMFHLRALMIILLNWKNKRVHVDTRNLSSVKF
ncbi:hypothetical protein PHJA_000223100 [Phtheirospermum japonicum]|uniref:Uncharacterized protein n=1 Tax=Phtheirospermum japonicum TaxID=374723 RepID=A0A830B712_9LAMI|nr:hypothetical protein PHJA_000223100 [Phtheirospermum japonicum]